MSDVWFISDTHLGHNNILNFKRNDGSPLRDFKTVYEMEGIIFDNWCKLVKPADKVYHLGDVAFTKGSLERMQALPGHKRLIRGNHDGFKLKTYAAVFEEIYGVRQIDGYWFTHVPMHPQSVGRAKLNVHGHLHANRVMRYAEDFDVNTEDSIDRQYYNVSVELTDYSPVNFDSIKEYYDRYVK